MYPPHAKLTLIADATVEPVALADAKSYLRIDTVDSGSADDLFIGDCIVAARLACMNLVDRTFLLTSWRLTLDYLPYSATGGLVGAAVLGFRAGPGPVEDGSITLPMPPLIALTAITYASTAGTVTSLDVTPEAGAVIVSPGTPGRIAPGYGAFFPFSRPTIAAVNIDYTAGYGTTPADVPRTVSIAMRLLIAHYYEHRCMDAPIPAAVSHLLDSVRWGRYA